MPNTAPWRTLLALSVFTICGRLAALQAAPAIEPLATTRLIAAPAPAAGGAWTIGVEIALKGKAITYWRDPGEAGVPPAFDFSASTNVEGATVAYPVPQRIHEGDIDAIGYEGTVVFPVRVTVTDPAKPAAVHLRLDYATCDRICLPAHADLALDLPPPASASNAGAIAHALSAVPRVLDGEEARAVGTVKEETRDGQASWLVVPADRGATDLFAEPPEGFFVATSREGSGFLVKVVEHPTGQPRPQTIRFTLVSNGTGVEFTTPSAP